MGKVTKLRAVRPSPELRKARELIASIDRARIIETMLGFFALGAVSSPQLHTYLWAYGVPERDYRDILTELLQRGAIDDAGGDDASVVLGLTKAMKAAMREEPRLFPRPQEGAEEARSTRRAAPTAHDNREAWRALTTAVEDLKAEIVKLDARDADTHRLRNILQVITLNVDTLEPAIVRPRTKKRRSART